MPLEVAVARKMAQWCGCELSGTMPRRAGRSIRRRLLRLLRGRWCIKPAGYIHYPYAISVVFVMSRSCQKYFGIGIFDLKKWLRLPCQCRFGRDVVTDLYVELFAAFHCDEAKLTVSLVRTSAQGMVNDSLELPISLVVNE